MLLKQLLEAHGCGRVDDDVFVALDQLVVLQRLFEDAFLLIQQSKLAVLLLLQLALLLLHVSLEVLKLLVFVILRSSLLEHFLNFNFVLFVESTVILVQVVV